MEMLMTKWRLSGLLFLVAIAAGVAAGPGTSRAAAALVQMDPPVEAADAKGKKVLDTANRIRGAKILVSTKHRWLWFIVAKDTLLSVPVAVGMNSEFVYEDKKFHFSTPIGQRKVLKKEEHPLWTVPEWHYMEKAKGRDLELVRLGAKSRVELADGSVLAVRGNQVGRVNQFGNFWAFTPGTEIVFDGKIFVPPLNTVQRRVPEALGPYKLDTGNGYLIHGTHIYNEDSIGEAVSHGCVRMDNFDLERLYYMVDPGTPVFIF
jgi:hypothetical protein